MTVPEQLRNLYRNERVIPFIGAGVSMSVEWEHEGEQVRGPSWGELVDQAARLLDCDPELLRVRGTDLQILEYFLACNQGEAAKLTNWLVRLMNPSDEALQNSAIHGELARLDRCRTFYTTNYDSFLERALALHGRTCDVVVSEADLGRRSGHCEVVKFHGDLDHPSMMVLSESHYEQRLSFSTVMDYRLRSDVLGRALLFIGYSFRDPNVAYLFRKVNEQFERLPESLTGKRAYILVPDPSDFEILLFNQRNIEVVPIRGASIASDTAAFLADLRS